MKVILSKQCESFTGSLGSCFGYHIQRRHNKQGETRFYGVRQSNGSVPPDGHWRFIVACAQLAKIGLHIREILVSGVELINALREAGYRQATYAVLASVEYSADGVLYLKERFEL